jgi:hypothetical protein
MIEPARSAVSSRSYVSHDLHSLTWLICCYGLLISSKGFIMAASYDPLLRALLWLHHMIPTVKVT